MKGLPVLIRLAKQAVDERQKELGQLAERQAALMAEAEAHAAQMEAEIFSAAQYPETAHALTAYLQAARRRQGGFETRAVALSLEDAHLRDELAAAYLELKRLETLMERLEIEAEASAARAEAAALDEAAILAAGRSR